MELFGTLPNNVQLALRDNNAILKAIVEGASDSIFVKDGQGRYLLINSAGAKNLHKRQEDIIGKRDADFLPPDLVEEIDQDDQLVMTSGLARTFENLVTLEGVSRVYHSTKAPYRDAQGNIIGIIGISRDITALKQAESGQRLLAEAGRILTTSLDYTTRLANVAQLVASQLADWCTIDLLDPDGSVERLTVAHSDPAKTALAQILRQHYPLNLKASFGITQVLRSGRSEFYPELLATCLEAIAGNEDHLQLLLRLKLKSLMIVPLISRGRILGAMSFMLTESNRHYDEADLNLAEEIARRAALALDNARIYKAEQEARKTAEIAAKRIASLQSITALLSEAVTPAQVARVIVEQGLAVLGASSGVITLLDERGHNLELLRAVGYLPERVNRWHRFSVQMPVPLAETVRTGTPIFISSLDMLAAHYPILAQQRGNEHHSLAAVPLIVKGRIIGSMGLSFVEVRPFCEQEQAFILALARQCAQALDRARLYEVEHEARTEAEATQQHLALLAETRERSRLAQELHDNVAQALGYLNLRLAVTNSLLTEGKIEEAQASLDELKNVVGETYTDVREEIFSLRAKVFSGLGFLELLDKYTDKYRRFYKLNIQIVKEEDESFFEFPPAVSPQIIRIIQEALINVRKHAKVDTAMIRLSHEADQIRISIEDEGQGFDPGMPHKKKASFGLQIMRERAESIGGELEIKTLLGQGSQVIIRLPVFKNSVLQPPMHDPIAAPAV
jgi:PAS domain S-box-containing protein